MKNGSDEILEAKVAERNERAKKLYRYVTELARRVGDMTVSSQSIMDLFSMHIEIQRQKLRDNCEKLFFLDPLNYGKKTLELLWRKVYYDTVSAVKKLRETDLENDNYINNHIVCGIGHFHHFISKISAEMSFQYKELDYVIDYNDEEQEELIHPLTDEDISFRKSALHSCLIYLGDLSRYQAEIFHGIESSIAARYYLQAAHIDLDSGMPYNQLGNLYLDKNYNLDSVCYYIHCLNCKTPFEGALDNLKKIFEKNEHYCEAILEGDTLNQTEHIQNTVANFLSLIEIWYLGKNDTNIPQRCNTIAHSLKVSMDFDISPLPNCNRSYDDYVLAVEEENTTPSYFNPNLVHKIAQICLFTIQKMMETDETKAFACKAFTLAFLAQLLQKLQKQLTSMGLKNPAVRYRERTLSIQEQVPPKIDDKVESEEEFELPEETEVNGACLSGEESGDSNSKESAETVSKASVESNSKGSEKLTNGDTKNGGKKANLKRRRRRRAASSESSELSAESDDSDGEHFESCSDENDSESSYHSDTDDSETDIEDTQNLNGDIKDMETEKEPLANGNVDKKIETPEINKPDKFVRQRLNELALKNFLLGNNTLASIKLLQDWALAEKDLILSCGDSGESLFQCVVDLFNILSHYFIHNSDMISEDLLESTVLRYARSIAAKVKFEYKNTPLPEDVNLRGTNICKFDKDAAEWQILDRTTLSVYEENVIRILDFMDFGNQIAKIVPKIRFNRTMKIFYLKKSTSKATKVTHKKKMEWHNSKKPQEQPLEGGLLKKLGRLWLTSQVRELERSGRQPAGPAFLALDTAVLHKHLRRVKLLLRAKSFILLVPTVVLQELDNLKREQSSARDAIRWLELQLKSGSRFVRAQRPGQARPLPLLKYPRKPPHHINNYIQILEFCNHFVSEDHGSGDSDKSLPAKSTPLLVLLVGNNDDEQYKEFSVTGAANSAGISVQFIEDFYAKWRHSAHKSGKKR